ncbi:MAG: CrcB family protein [Lactobacillaceae bacterium]|jgi:CrcB protein|nr:CrcB family protein [Lactobacillaceae bacterium]
MMQILIAGLGAMVGSWLRYGLLTIAPRVFGPAKSWMIMVINLSAALLIGITFGMHLSTLQNAFWAVGILGGYSTFSAPIVELADAFSHPGELPMVLTKILIAFIGGVPILLIGVWVGKMF